MPLSADDKLLLERIEVSFGMWPSDDEKAHLYNKLRSLAANVARLVIEVCPNGRERSLALTKLEESMMWANAAIMRHEAG
jgi:hypothetical protein